MMPEQQSLVLYMVVGSSSKNALKAPRAVSKVRLDGSLTTGRKPTPGFQKWLRGDASMVRL